MDLWLVQTLFDGIIEADDNGGRKIPISSQLGYTKDQVEAIQQLKNSKDDHERLGLASNATTLVQNTLIYNLIFSYLIVSVSAMQS